ncbi:M91 family zinc metallopeptidase [Paraburkholderia terrae]|uniref:M91 family zinc metallopeptidase n=1 Tax=Paraburkholderia terrae TaxID=311230 RepID=UPI0033655A34
MNLLMDQRLIVCVNSILARFAMTLRTETKSVEGTVRRPSNEEQVNFQRNVDESLAQIRSTEIGSSLLDDIARAGHELVILRVTPSVGNKCRQTELSVSAGAAACYKELLSVQSLWDKIQELTSTGRITEQNPAVKKFMKFYFPLARGGNKEAYQCNVRQRVVPLAHKKGEQRQLEAEVGGTKVSSLQRGLIAYHIMDHLTPGPGTGAQVLWNPSSDRICGDLPAERRAAWMDRPPWVALAHEMIHGWRLVTGRCVFQPGGIEDYWEEAMTVGLPPYDRCRFTENRFRHVKALPLRTYYGESTLNRSNNAAIKHSDVSSRLQISFSIKVVGSGPNDPLVFDYDMRPAGKPDEIISGKTDARGRATVIAQWMTDGEIRFYGFGAFGRVETQWQKILISRQMTLQFGRYSFICEPFY